MQRAVSFLSSLKRKKVLVLTHSGADVDSFASAAALYFTFRGSNDITIGVPEHISNNARAFARRMKVPFKISPSGIDKYDAVIIVDLNAYDMLGKMQDEVKACKKPILLIDHHAKGKGIVRADVSLILEEYISTTELIYELLWKAGIKLNPDAAKSIAAGVVTDSAGFLVADHETFAVMADALRIAKIPFSELLSLFALKTDISEKIANIKAAQRLRLYRVADSLIVSTNVGCFGGGVATHLTKLGADAAFAGDEEEGKIRISGRASRGFIKHTRIDLAKDVFAKLSNEFGGSSGGHPGAAAYNGKGKDLETLLHKCVMLVFEYMKSKNKRLYLKEYLRD